MYEILSKLMLDKGIKSHYEIFKATGVSQSSLSDWKKGKGTPGMANIVKLAEFFNVSTDYMMGIDKEKPNGITDGLNEQDQIVLNNFRQLSDDDKALVASLISKLKQGR